MFIKLPVTENSNSDFDFINTDYIIKIGIIKVYYRCEITSKTETKFRVCIFTTDGSIYKLPLKDTYESAESYVKSICQGDLNEYTST